MGTKATRKRIRVFFLPGLLLCLLSVAAGCRSSGGTGITPAGGFELERYLGRWYEIARMNFTFERNMSNVSADYSLDGDGSVKVLNRGYNFVQRKWKQIEGRARSSGRSGDGALRVSFFGPLRSDYIVLAVDESYNYALVAGGGRDRLWILSRKPTMPEGVRRQYVAMAKSLGYRTDLLVWTVHDAR